MIVYKCDECGIEIPIIKKEILGREIEMFDCGQLKCEQINLSTVMLNPNYHLCKTCAQKLSAQIDYELLKYKMEILKKDKGRDKS